MEKIIAELARFEQERLELNVWEYWSKKLNQVEGEPESFERIVSLLTPRTI